MVLTEPAKSKKCNLGGITFVLGLDECIHSTRVPPTCSEALGVSAPYMQRGPS